MDDLKYKFKPDIFHNYRCALVRVIDADTVRLSVDLGFRISFTDNFRLARIDAPEINTPEGRDAAFIGVKEVTAIEYVGNWIEK